MTPGELIEDLAREGVVLYLKDGKLKYQADAGAYTDERRAIVAQHREALIEALTALAGPSSQDVQKSSSSAAAPWHPEAKRVPDPAEHWKGYGRGCPPALAPTLEAIAKAWSHTKHKTKLKDGTEQRFESLSLRREYERLAGWAIAEPATITPDWVAEQVARWETPPSKPMPMRMSPYWARRWRELEEGGYVPGGMDAGGPGGTAPEGAPAGDRDDGDAGHPTGSPDGAPRQPVAGRVVRSRPARSA